MPPQPSRFLEVQY